APRNEPSRATASKATRWRTASALQRSGSMIGAKRNLTSRSRARSGTLAGPATDDSEAEMNTTAIELPTIVHAGVPSGRNAPSGYERLESDVDWDPKYVEITPPERVITLDELGPGAAGPDAFSPVAATTPF